MRIAGETVAIARCGEYRPALLTEVVDSLCRVLGFAVSRGARVLLKPNLISGARADGLACTHPQLVAAVARWFVDHGAKVAVGDSPAFGTAVQVMQACGYQEALQGLPVARVNFLYPTQVRLGCGETVGIDRAALECDLLVNLPKVKAHCQMLVSLAVKNYFGTVVGWRKPWLHAKHGDIDHRFEALLVDLLAVLPGGLALADGIVAMHGSGPVKGGRPHALGLVAGSVNPVALETALLEVLGVPCGHSPLWLECQRRRLPGTDPAALVYPLLDAAAVQVADFDVPQGLRPVSFRPHRLLLGALKRIAARCGL